MLSRTGVAAVLVVCAALLAVALWPRHNDSVEVATGSQTSPAPVSFTVPPQQMGLRAEALPAPLSPVPDCDITQPTTGTPPGETRPYEHVVSQNGHAVGLWPDGIVVFKAGQAGSVEPDGSLGMKFWWWRPVKGGKLEITGHRLDADAPPLQADIPGGYDGQYFQATGLAFPTQGCWEVTGRAGDATITFVTLVLVER